MPFMAVWFKAYGMNGAAMGLIFALPMIARVFTSPFIAVMAERANNRRSAFVVLSLIAAIGFILLWLMREAETARFWWFLLLWGIGSTASAALNPFCDILTHQMADRKGFDFGIPRAFGSFAFVVAAILMGYALNQVHVDTIIFAISLFSLLGAAYALWILPVPETVIEDVPKAHAPKTSDRLRVLMQNRVFIALVCAVGLIQASHGFHYSFSTLIWKSQGISVGLCGWLWAIGVIAEIIYMAFGQPIRKALSPQVILMMAGVVTIIRWAALYFAPPLWALWPLQILHGISFGATYMAGLALLKLVVPSGYESIAQFLVTGVGIGMLTGFSSLVSGPLYDAYATGGYAVMTLIAMVGLCFAIWIFRQARPNLSH